MNRYGENKWYPQNNDYPWVNLVLLLITLYYFAQIFGQIVLNELVQK